ncbi:hypothetical protein HKD37_02G005262 [Glycine soja]
MKNISHRVLLLALFLASFTFISSTSTQQQEAKHDPIAINMETKLGTQRKLLGYVPEAKKAALQNLEDVLLEPPRAASGKSRVYLKRTKYLPDLMGDSLEGYPRRVFIDVGLPEKDGGSGTDWFHKTYPTRNKDFEIYKIETVAEGGPQIEMSDWLRKNVREEEYVVMKSEAEVVEEMMRSKAIMLVDELFLECKPQQGNAKKKNRRAYWECLALYGKLRDEGIPKVTHGSCPQSVLTYAHYIVPSLSSPSPSVANIERRNITFEDLKKPPLGVINGWARGKVVEMIIQLLFDTKMIPTSLVSILPRRN